LNEILKSFWDIPLTEYYNELNKEKEKSLFLVTECTSGINIVTKNIEENTKRMDNYFSLKKK